jgi:MoaA/NifB/PqqE/SkfB family radical SAM enzyme
VDNNPERHGLAIPFDCPYPDYDMVSAGDCMSDYRRFEVASIHFTKDCNLSCSFCYRDKTRTGREKDFKFFLELVPYIKQLGIPQIALGGGEPTLYPEFISAMSAKCAEYGIILNITSNGRLLMDSIGMLEALKGVTMVSLSLDNEKVKSVQDMQSYVELIHKIHRYTDVQVGCNLLVDENMMKVMPALVDKLFEHGIDRVFALCPKNFHAPDILRYVAYYSYCTVKHEHFYVDDLTRKILHDRSYGPWRTPCHYGGLISIDDTGLVKGCSFDTDRNAVLELHKPSDLMLIKKVRFKSRHECPFLIKPKGVE